MNESATTNTTNRLSSQIDRYSNLIGKLDEEIASDSIRWKTLSMVRGVTFLIAATLLIPGFMTYAGHRPLWFVMSGVVFAGFLYIAFIHEGIESSRRKKQIWRRLYRWSLARLRRDWDNLKQVPIEISTVHSAITNDLDLFGRSSLFQLVGGVETPSGISTFRDWILEVPTAKQVCDRQSAVQELQKALEFRDPFRFICHLLSAGDGESDSLTSWSESPIEFDRSGFRIWIARLFALLTAVALVSLLTGLVPLTLGGPFVLAMLGLNFMWTVLYAGKIHTVFNQVSTRHGEIDNYNLAFRMIRESSFHSTQLVKLRDELFLDKSDVLAATSHLGRIAWRANLRRHGMLFIVYVVIQFAFLWDFHTIRQLQNWKVRHGSNVRRWFEVLGQWEVLAALAQFAEDHDQWVTPQVTDKKKQEVFIHAEGLGHPLLKHTERVDNDVQVGPSGSVLLVTGSNMSGKSTLLRSIGLNVILAHLGAPVCAEKMSLSPMRIETSMRIQDSLADGVSFFMAELKRLKQIVDIAREYESNSHATVLFLLDEILQGTNSMERHIAVTRVIRHLIDHKAIGAVSTHDLELGSNGELVEACRPVHFRESFERVDGKRIMTFDYLIRDGIATTTNALKLLELVGLDDAIPEQTDPGLHDN